MKQLLKNILLAGAFTMFVASPVMAVATPVVSSVSAADCSPRFLGIPAWYRGLAQDDGRGGCAITSPESSDGLSGFIWQIVLNIIEMALVIVAYIAVFFIIYGGFLYITGGSNPSQTEKARKSIVSAVIGLAIALGAIAITNLIFGIVN